MKTRAMTLMLALTLAACSSSSSGENDSATKEAGVDASDIDASKDAPSVDAAKDGATDKSAPDEAVPDRAVPDRTVPDADDDWPVVETWVGAPCTEKGESCTDESDEDFCVIGGYWVWQGGYCTKDCILDDPSTCPKGSYCSMFNEDGPNPNYCVKNCKTAADCRAAEGYICDYWGGCIWFQ
jgi:hypothetical protein